MSKKALWGRLALFATTILWGTAFVVQKNILDAVEPLWLLSLRFCGSALITLPFTLKLLRQADKKCVAGGVLMGVFLFLAYSIQTYGLKYTTPAKNAFLTTAYCVLVPFIHWAASRRRPDRCNIAAALLSVVGVGLVSLSGDLSVGRGDMLTLIGAFFYALQIIAADRALDFGEVLPLLLIQNSVCGALSLVGAALTEPAPAFASLGQDAWLSLAYLIVLCTAATAFLQIYGQQRTPPSQAALIMALESVVGTVTSLLFYADEVMTLRIGCGFALLFIAVVISETKLSFLRQKKEK